MEIEVKKTIYFIRKNLEEDFSIHALAKVSGYSVFHFSRNFKKITGESVMSYVKRLRLEKASEQLLVRDKSILEISLIAGFKTSTGFLKAFKSKFGLTPTAYTQKYKKAKQCSL